MKRPLFLLLLTVVFGLSVYAKEIPREVASQVAAEFLHQYTGETVTTSSRIVANGNPVTDYVVFFGEKGWVWVAGDDQVKPVLAYGTKANFSDDLMSQYPFRSFFKGIQRDIAVIIEKNEGVVHPEWASLEKGQRLKSTMATVEPFIPAKFNQDRGWNDMCPVDAAGSGGHAYAGCVAVAMAQAMSVYKYPIEGVDRSSYTHEQYGNLTADYGSTTYNWADMKMASADEYNALLLYHCGVSVEMGYGADGSGAYTQDVPNAMRKYFNYASSTRNLSRANYEDDEWNAILRAELDAGRPILYSGNGDDGQSGHAFNFDGYKGDYFHVNWGYSGSMNGYFTVDNLMVGESSYAFNSDAVIGIVPAEDFSDKMYAPTNIMLASTEVLEGKPIGTFVSEIEIDDDTQEDVFAYECFGSPLIGGGYRDADFYIENDSLFTSVVFDRDKKASSTLIIKVTDNGQNTFQKQFIIDIAVNSAATDYRNEDYAVYPNPSAGVFNLDWKKNACQGSVYNLTGNLVCEYNLLPGQNRLDLSRQVKGIYFLKVGGVSPQLIKLVKQ